MTNEKYNAIREKYIEKYPHLAHIKSKKVFALNALRLAAPSTVKAIEVLELSEIL